MDGGHHWAPETEGNIWGEGCRVCEFLLIDWWWTTEWYSRTLVFSLKLPSSTWVGAPVLQKDSKILLCIFLE